MTAGTTFALDMSAEGGGREVTVDDEGTPVDDIVATEKAAADEAGVDFVDGATNPDAFNSITQSILRDEEEDFSIDGPPDGSARLLAGFVDPSGNRFLTCTLRELRGRDEEAMARAMANSDLTRYVDTILRAGVVTVGDVEKASDVEVALDSLCLGDRDALLLQIRRLSFGDTQRLSTACPYCEHKFDVDYSYSTDVPMKQYELEPKDQRTHQIDLPSGAVCEVRLIDGKAQKSVYTTENLKKVGEELNTMLLKACLRSIDGQQPTTARVLDMTSRDRKHLLNWLVENQPGPQYQDVKQECPECAREFPLVVDVRTMFRGE